MLIMKSKCIEDMQYAALPIGGGDHEWPVKPEADSAVFVLMCGSGCEEGYLPHTFSQTPGEVEEEKRVAYVGATRAKVGKLQAQLAEVTATWC
jgi:hypothetical protein